MKKIWAIAWKDARIRFASRSELLFFFILPVIFTFLLAGGTPSGNEDNRLRLLVADNAQTELSQEIIAALEGSSAVRPEVISEEAARNEYDQRQASNVLILPTDLNRNALLDGSAEVELLQQPNDINASIAERAIWSALRQVSSVVDAAQFAVLIREQQQRFASPQEQAAYFSAAEEIARSINQASPELIATTTGSTKQDDIEYDPLVNSSAGQVITWVFIPLFGISSLFAFERQQGTLKRILTTPSRKTTYLVGTIAGQVAMALVQMALLLGVANLILDVNWGRQPLALFVILFGSTLAAAAFGTTLGTMIKTSGQAQGLSIMFGMLFAMLGGCWYPLELFPKVVQSAVRVLPTTWAMQGMLDLGLRGGGLVDILPETGVLLGFALVFLTIGVLRFRYE